MKENISLAGIPSDIQEKIDTLLSCINTPSPSFMDPTLSLTFAERLFCTRKVIRDMFVFAYRKGCLEEIVERFREKNIL